jgi:hypothetical protein
MGFPAIHEQSAEPKMTQRFRDSFAAVIGS